MDQKNIVVIGSYLVALVMDTERIPLKGETVLAKNFHQAHGGKGSNQAVQVARLGVPTSFIGRVGADSYGEAFIQLCNAEHINATHVIKSKHLPTGAGFIVCDKQGHNIIAIDIGAINEFNEQDIDAAIDIVTAKSIVLLQLEVPLATALYAAKKAKEKGAVVILNPAPATDLTSYDLSAVDFLTPNETELRVCLGLAINDKVPDEVAAKKLLQLGCENVLVTLGEKGSYWCNASTSVAIEGFEVAHVADTTGAGDSFNAGFACALSEGKPVIDAIRFAHATASLSVTKQDTIPSYHYRQEVDQFLEMTKALENSET